MNPLMRVRSCFPLSKTWLGVMFFAGCVGQGPADDGVESVTRGIQNGTLVGAGGVGYAAKIDQVMSDGKRLICTGAFITPHVVLTAAHCTRNYDYGTTITPTTDTVIRYGKDFASSQKIAGGEKVGWRELGSTDIGLYRVAQAVTLPVIPKVYRTCATVNLVGGRVVVYGRMINGSQAPTAALYMSAERVVRAIASNVGANGNYVQIDSTTDSGDSGGPWVSSPDRIVAVTHTSAYGSRFCDVAAEIETQVKEWGDTLSFVEDSGTDAGSPDMGGATGRADAASKLDGPSGANDAGGAGGRADAGGATGSAGRSGTGGGAGGLAGGAGASGSSVTTSSGAGGAGGALSQTSRGGSSAGTGGKAAGGSAGGVTSSGIPSSAGSAGSAAGGSSSRSSASQGGTRADSQSSATAGHRANSGTASGGTDSGCSCRTLGDSHGRPSANLALLLVIASASARIGKGKLRRMNARRRERY